MTQREIADQVAYQLGDPFNIPLIRSIEESVLPARSVVLRREVNKRLKYPSWAMQTLGCQELKEVDFGECAGADVSTAYALRTKEALPAPVRTTLMVPFDFVGTTDHRETYQYMDTEMVTHFNKGTKYVYKHPRYTLIDGYIYVFNVYEDYISIRGIFDNPSLASGYQDCEPKYEIEEDMVYLIKRFLYEEFGGVARASSGDEE